MANNSKKNNSFLLQGGILAIASILVRVIGLIYRIPLARILGREGMGFYSTAFEAYNIALILSSFSLPIAVSKLVSARLAKKDRANALEVFKCALIFALVVGIIIASIMFFGSDLIAKLLGNYLSAYALKVLSPCLFFVSLLGVIRGYFQGYGTMVPTAISQVLEQIVNAIVSIIASYGLYAYGKTVIKAKNMKNIKLVPAAYGAAGGTLGTVMGAFSALCFLGFVFYIFYKANKTKLYRNMSSRHESTRTIFPILLATIFPIILSSALTNVCNILDIAMFNNAMKSQGMALGKYTALLGVFSETSTLTNVPITLAYAIGTSAIPALSTALVLGERASINKKIKSSVNLSMLVVIPSFIGYMFLASPIMRMIYSDPQSKSAYIFMTSSGIIVFYSLFTLQNAILQGLNKLIVPIKNSIVSLAIHIISLMIFLHVFKINIFAVILSNIIFALSMCYLNNRAIYKASGYRQEYKKTFILPLLSALVMGISSRLLYSLFKMLLGNTIGVILAAMLGILIYLVVLIKIGGLGKKEICQFPKGHKIVLMLERMRIL